MSRMVALAASVLILIAPVSSWALFHIAVIDEVMSGAGGNPNVQYVEIRMLGNGQNQVCHTRLTVFKCQADGGGSQVLINDLTAVGGSSTQPCVPDGTAGHRWIMASPSAAIFLAASGITPDATWDNAVPAGSNIPLACGMVCWGAPGIIPPNPPTWDATNPANYVDCVAYGPYDGTAEPLLNPAETDTPGDGTFSLTRVSTDSSMFSNNFALACPSPTSNPMQTVGNFGACSPPTTTTTSSTTTTTVPPPAKSKCTSKELLAGGKKAKAKANCHAKAVGKGDSSKLPGCLTKAETKFSSAYAKATTKADCINSTDASTVEGKVDSFITTLTNTLVAGSTARSACTCRELRASGKKAAAKVKCHAKGVAKGDTSSVPACLTKAEAKFSSAYAKAAKPADCINGTDGDTVEAQVDTFVNDLKNTLAP